MNKDDLRLIWEAAQQGEASAVELLEEFKNSPECKPEDKKFVDDIISQIYECAELLARAIDIESGKVTPEQDEQMYGPIGGGSEDEESYGNNPMGESVRKRARQMLTEADSNPEVVAKLKEILFELVPQSFLVKRSLDPEVSGEVGDMFDVR